LIADLPMGSEAEDSVRSVSDVRVREAARIGVGLSTTDAAAPIPANQVPIFLRRRRQFRMSFDRI